MGTEPLVREADPTIGADDQGLDAPAAARAPITDSRLLSGRVEPFDSFWQAPDDVEKGYRTFEAYYRVNYLPHMPADRDAQILVISCGPGYLVHTLNEAGYTNVLGIDSFPDKIAHATAHGLNCRQARAFEFLAEGDELYDVIIPEQELNHLTHLEMHDFLTLCRRRLKPGGLMLAYGLNGANPIVGSENLSHNIDHFNTFTEYSLGQILGLAGFENIRILPLRVYVFYKNPLNYVGWGVTAFCELGFRILFKLYGKNVKHLTKKIAAVCTSP